MVNLSKFWPLLFSLTHTEPLQTYTATQERIQTYTRRQNLSGNSLALAAVHGAKLAALKWNMSASTFMFLAETQNGSVDTHAISRYSPTKETYNKVIV